MLDFAKLNSMTAEDRVSFDATARARSLVADDADRLLKSKIVVTGKLVYEPELRSLATGEEVVVFKAVQKNHSVATNVAYVLSDRERTDVDARDALDLKLRSMGGGDEVSFAGQWQKRSWRQFDGSIAQSWEFASKGFEKGDVSMERIMQRDQSTEQSVHLADRMSSLAAAHKAQAQDRGV